MDSTYIGENTWDKEAVHYFTPAERDARRVQIANGRLQVNGAPLDSTSRVSIVMTPEKELFVGLPGEMRNTRHSSFTSGGEVIFAGNIGVHNGQIAVIDASSGHYKTPPFNALPLLKLLGESSVNLGSVELRIFYSRPNGVKAQELLDFLSHPGATFTSFILHIADTQTNKLGVAYDLFRCLRYETVAREQFIRICRTMNTEEAKQLGLALAFEANSLPSDYAVAKEVLLEEKEKGKGEPALVSILNEMRQYR